MMVLWLCALGKRGVLDPDPRAHGGHRVSNCAGSGSLVGEMHWLVRSAGLACHCVV